MGHARLAAYGGKLAEMFGLDPDDVCYSVMPLFHSNAAVAGFANVLAAGATGVLRRRFSASSFLPDVRRYGVTFFNYVGKPLSYILATPEQPDDADNSLRIAFGNEAAPLDIDRFARRFGCIVADGYGSTEGGLNMSRTPDTPKGSLGLPVAPIRAVILDPDTAQECPPAEFDAARTAAQRRSRDRRDRESRRRRRLRGLLQQPRSQRRARARRRVLDRRPRLPRRRTASSTSRAAPATGCASTARTSPRRPSSWCSPAIPTSSLAAVYAVPSVEVGDEVMVALHLRAGRRLRPRRVRRVPRPSNPTSRRSGCRASCASPRAAVDRDAEGVEARPAPRALGMRPTRCGGGRGADGSIND